VCRREQHADGRNNHNNTGGDDGDDDDDEDDEDDENESVGKIVLSDDCRAIWPPIDWISGGSSGFRSNLWRRLSRLCSSELFRALSLSIEISLALIVWRGVPSSCLRRENQLTSCQS
jgi:hypothetical protein